MLFLFFQITGVPVPIIDPLAYESRAVLVSAIRQKFIPHRIVPGAYLYSSDPLKENMTLRQYTLSRPNRNTAPAFGSLSPAEYYWNNLANLDITYGADIRHNYCDGNEFDAGCLPGILHGIDCEVPGVTDTYAYCGEFGSTFSMHVEDFNLHSLNLVIDGASKIWYGVLPHAHQLVKNLANQLYGDEVQCGLPLIHKLVVLSPELLRLNNIPFCTVSILKFLSSF